MLTAPDVLYSDIIYTATNSITIKKNDWYLDKSTGEYYNIPPFGRCLYCNYDPEVGILIKCFQSNFAEVLGNLTFEERVTCKKQITMKFEQALSLMKKEDAWFTSLSWHNNTPKYKSMVATFYIGIRNGQFYERSVDENGDIIYDMFQLNIFETANLLKDDWVMVKEEDLIKKPDSIPVEISDI